MKNMYFGDKHDFYKYDLLLYLMEASLDLRQWLWVVMLTPDDRSRDGNFIGYKAGNRSVALCEWLQQRVRSGQREVARLGSYPAIRYARSWRYVPILEPLPADAADRATYFGRATEALAPHSLVFLDPDNGLMPRSARGGGRRKYVDHQEVCELYEAMDDGSLLVVYQHRPQAERAESAYRRLLGELRERCGIRSATAIAPDGDVAYLLACRTEQRLAEIEAALAPYLEENGFSCRGRRSLGPPPSG